MLIMTNPKIVMVRLDKWKVVSLPEDIQFDHFEFDGKIWWWNEEKKLLIDSYGIMRKTNKDMFLHFYIKWPMIFNQVSQQVVLANSINHFELDLFQNWYAATKVH